MKKFWYVYVGLFHLMILQSVDLRAEDGTDFGSRTPGVDEIVNGLRPPTRSVNNSANSGSRQGMMTRGINMEILQPPAVEEESPAVVAEQALEQPLANPEPSVVMRSITFKFNSAEIMQDSRQTLDNIGVALTTQDLESYAYIIEGHTDAAGPEKYNSWLSMERAISVRNYLITNHRIDPVRLKPIGKGETELDDPGKPYGQQNRRVKIKFAASQ